MTQEFICFEFKLLQKVRYERMHAEDTDSGDTKADDWRKLYKELYEDF